MPKLVYRPSARDDLAEIYRFIRRDNPRRARSFVREIEEQCARLARLPGTLGTPRPQLRSDVRSFAFKGYVILFRYDSGAFEVVNVIEGHRDIDALFRQP